ncbi:hypothetical protein R3P38DRAFT_495574 [Favolaschia claudopus]|uniref:Uncharacterized protein n=1 Tax=Favolaschia claudopus TaxID=2862362 RepID=A0AAW0CPP3_9AGAR
MFSTRFISLLVASVAASVLAKANTTTAPSPETLPGDTLTVCVDPNLSGQCDTVAFVEGVCLNMPATYVNTMTSVRVPPGWACTFYDLRSNATVACDPITGFNTLLLAPGSPDLRLQHFDDVVDQFRCHQLCA